MSGRKRAAILFGVVALLLLTTVVGRVWLGWGYIADNEKILDSLPVPPGAQRISVDSRPYSSQESVFIPPDGWGTLATYQAPAEASSDYIVDFYSSRLSAEWRYCVNYVNTHDVLILETGVDLPDQEPGVVMTGVSFTRGLSLVSIYILSMTTEGPHSYEIFVDHEREFDTCAGEVSQ